MTGKVLICAFVLLLPSVLPAESDLRFMAGAGAIVVNAADNLSGSGSKSINSLNHRPEGTTRLLPAVVFDLRLGDAGPQGEWVDGFKSEYYLATSFQEPGMLSAGMRAKKGSTLFDGRISYDFTARAWENPYTPVRTETSMMRSALRLSAENIGATGIALSLRSLISDVKRDRAATADPALAQDGVVHTVELSKRYAPGDGFSLFPGVQYEQGRYDGRANRYDRYGVVCEARKKKGDGVLTARLTFSRSEYDAVHPLFGRRREEQVQSLFLTATKQRLWGSSDLSAVVGALYGRTDSAIEFFETRRAGIFFILIRRFR